MLAASRLAERSTIAGARALLGLFLVPATFCHVAHAGSELAHTFVSMHGYDQNDCSRQRPCLTFDAALRNVASGGEVTALDSGDYPAFTVSKPVRIRAEGANRPSVAGVPSGTSSYPLNATTIRIDAGQGTVSLDNIIVTQSGDSKIGIYVVSAADVELTNVDVLGAFHYGVQMGARVPLTFDMTNVNILHGAATGNESSGALLGMADASPPAGVSLQNVHVSGYRNGIDVDAAARGVLGVQIADTRIDNAGHTGLFVFGNNQGQPSLGVRVFVANSQITHCNMPLLQRDNSIVYLSNTIITNNSWLPQGVIYSYGNNDLEGNANQSGSPLKPVLPK